MNVIALSLPKNRKSIFAVLLISFAVGMLFSIFHDGLVVMESFWSGQAEYSYGYLIPVIVAILIWQKLPELRRTPLTGSWWGVIILSVGFIMYALGVLSSTTLLVQYAFVLAIIGFTYAVIGRKAIGIILLPLLLLFLMIPLPQFLYQGLSSELQLLSSKIGVFVIRLFGISVFLDGNVIDLGTYKLQVVEACSGLRYLFPLFSFGIVCAYLFKAPWWQRIIVVLSTIPITVLLNSLRIGIIGVLVEYWGNDMAEGFLHDFEGWIIFMVCVAILFFEMAILTRIFNKSRRFRDVFGLVSTPNNTAANTGAEIRLRLPLLAALGLIVFASIVSIGLEKRQEKYPDREAFSSFPTTIGDWQGQRTALQSIYLQALKLTDYLMVDFRNSSNDVVNVYSAYYQSQREGATIHSPRSCIPGDGWRIDTIQQTSFTRKGGDSLTVNRAQIAKGSNKQLVYYWFDQRGRALTNEYLVKWFLFWDALTLQRTDGALIRITTSLKPGETWQDAEKRLQFIAQSVEEAMGRYIPGR